MTGYQSKKAAAQAKVEGPIHVVCQCDKCKAQLAQDKLHEKYDDMYVVYLNGVYDGKKQRPWVGLTLDEIVQIGIATGLERAAVDMISNKLKEKNNAT